MLPLNAIKVYKEIIGQTAFGMDGGTKPRVNFQKSYQASNIICMLFVRDEQSVIDIFQMHITLRFVRQRRLTLEFI